MEGVSVSLAVKIANAESGVWDDNLKRKLPNPDAHNPIGTASGVYQFLDSSFINLCIKKYKLASSLEEKNIPTTQIRCAITVLKEKNGYRHWLASMDTWG